MSRQRLSFTPEAASLVLDQAVLKQPARWGWSSTTLLGWVNQLQTERRGVTLASKALTPEQQKLQKLEARINRLEREN